MRARQGRWLWALVLVLAAVFALSAWGDGELRGWISGLLVVANTGPLLLIARNPLVVVVLLFSVTYPLWLAAPFDDAVVKVGNVLQSLPTLVALYATGAWDRPLWLRSLALITPVWMLGAALVGLWNADIDQLSFVAVVLVIVWALGVLVAGRRSYARELEDKTRQLQQARHALAERAVADERTRVARELHDVIAHAMSVITIQAGVGRHLLASRPDRAAQALDIITRTGREALEELRRMLVVLRAGPSDRLGGPQPGVADLSTLVDTARAGGLAIELVREGPAPALPAGLDLTVYRVVQEALTNVAKHAGGAAARVTLRRKPGRLLVQVCDQGDAAPTPVVPGHGLTGMAERVALYDGTLAITGGPQGFRVSASFPVDHDERAGGRDGDAPASGTTA